MRRAVLLLCLVFVSCVEKEADTPKSDQPKKTYIAKPEQVPEISTSDIALKVKVPNAPDAYREIALAFRELARLKNPQVDAILLRHKLEVYDENGKKIFP